MLRVLKVLGVLTALHALVGTRAQHSADLSIARRGRLRVSHVRRPNVRTQIFGSGSQEDPVEQPFEFARALGQCAGAVACNVTAPEQLVRDVQSGQHGEP